MKLKEMIEKRQEFNREISRILKGYLFHEAPITIEGGSKTTVGELFDFYVEKCSQLRAGQIFCNYICPDYRDKEPAALTVIIMDAIFDIQCDPFYEESYETLKRLKVL